MPATPKRLGRLLPRNWPSQVRSAVVHAISMSNVVFTVTRSHGENHFNARVRIQAENDRLRREVSLLRAELRIKDSRMERIPPYRRPHYPPIERLAILELRAARGWSKAQTARRLLVTPLTVASWSNRLGEEGAAALVQGCGSGSSNRAAAGAIGVRASEARPDRLSYDHQGAFLNLVGSM